MSILSTDDVAALRSVEGSAHPTTVTIRTPTVPTSDGAGGFTPNPPSTTTVAGRVVPRSGDEALDNDRLAEIGRYVLRVATDTAISADATVSAGGRSWRVVYTPPADALDAVREIGLEEVA